jgi:AcrR family transcriptional regulator
MVTVAPRAAKARAVASPIPALAPMITTRRPSNDMMSAFRIVETDCLYKLYRYCRSRQIDKLPVMDDGPRRPHTGRRRNDAAQEAILDAVFRLLSDPAAESITIDAIAAEAGVGRQTIYRWWPSKGAVLVDALARHARATVPERESGSFAGDLAAFLVDSFAGLENAGYAARLRQIVAEAQRDETVARLLADFTAVRRAALRALLERGRATGELAADANLDMLVDMAYGVLYYRLLIGHAPLSE